MFRACVENMLGGNTHSTHPALGVAVFMWRAHSRKGRAYVSAFLHVYYSVPVLSVKPCAKVVCQVSDLRKAVVCIYGEAGYSSGIHLVQVCLYLAFIQECSFTWYSYSFRSWAPTAAAVALADSQAEGFPR